MITYNRLFEELDFIFVESRPSPSNSSIVLYCFMNAHMLGSYEGDRYEQNETKFKESVRNSIGYAKLT